MRFEEPILNFETCIVCNQLNIFTNIENKHKTTFGKPVCNNCTNKYTEYDIKLKVEEKILLEL